MQHGAITAAEESVSCTITRSHSDSFPGAYRVNQN